MSQTIFMFVLQCEIILMFIIIGLIFVIDILIIISLLILILDGLTVIYNEFDVNSLKISEFGRSCDSSSSNSNIVDESMIERVGMSFCLSVNYYIMQVLKGLSLNTVILIKFNLFFNEMDRNLAFGVVYCGTPIIHDIFCIFYQWNVWIFNVNHDRKSFWRIDEPTEAIQLILTFVYQCRIVLMIIFDARTVHKKREKQTKTKRCNVLFCLLNLLNILSVYQLFKAKCKKFVIKTAILYDINLVYFL